jgi:hypothetical protein
MRPKPAKLMPNPLLREYVQERLAGNNATPGGQSIAGPQVEWKSRRRGPRQARRWSKAWSPEQIANRLLMDFPEDTSMRISHEAIYQALYVAGPWGAAQGTDRLPAHRTRLAGAQAARA